MRTMSLVLIACLLCSFAGKMKVQNSLAEYGLKGKVSAVIEYEYFKVSGKEELFSKRTYTYDSEGNRTTDSSFDKNGRLVTGNRTEHKYEDKGRHTEKNVYNMDGTLSWRTVYVYDDNSVLTGSKRYHPNGMLEERYAYKYDSRGNLVQENSYNGVDAANCVSVYTYDDHDELIGEDDDCSSVSWVDSASTVKTHFSYDQKTNEQAYVEHDKANRIVYISRSSKTDPDKMGNWTRMVSTRQRHGKTDTFYYKREIVYYR